VSFAIHIAIVCGFCAERNYVARAISEPGTVRCICRGCETPLQAKVRDPGVRTWKSAHDVRMSFAGSTSR